MGALLCLVTRCWHQEARSHMDVTLSPIKWPERHLANSKGDSSDLILLMLHHGLKGFPKLGTRIYGDNCA